MQGFESLVFVVLLGTLADAAFTTVFLMEDSDNSDMSSANSVLDPELLPFSSGSTPEIVAAFDQADDDLIRRIGYVGFRRYVRLTITPSDNTGDLPIAIVAALSHPTTLPVATQLT